MFNKDVVERKEILKNYLKDLGIDISKVKDENLMLQAFIHKSFAKDFSKKKDIPHNERLEFVGDAILGGIIAKFLYTNYPNIEEGQLTLYKIALVKEETLANIARKIKLGEFIFLGHGEERTGGRDKSTILADSLEALIGYIFLDLGFQEVEKFVEKYVYSKLEEIKKTPIKPYKSLLQEKVQKLYKAVPEYKDYEWEKDEKGNIVLYKSEVFVLGKKMGEGFGQNKKKAQEEAAKNAYESWL